MKQKIQKIKHYYLGHYILQLSAETFIVSVDNSKHTSLLSAKIWIDHLTR